MSSAKDKALMEANALVGYCRSAPHILNAEKRELRCWVDGLVELAEKTATEIDKSYAEKDTTHDK